MNRLKGLPFTQVLLAFLMWNPNCLSSGAAEVEERLTDASATTVQKHKYLVSIRLNGAFTCGGSLVNPLFVVTAAHCVQNRIANELSVVGGTSLHSGGTGVHRKVVKIIASPVFNLVTLSKDVAVLKLESPLEGENIASIALCNSKLPPGTKINVAGWGLTGENKRNLPKKMRMTGMRVLPKRACQRKYRRYKRLTRSMLCAQGERGSITCDGDSGGPLVHNGRLCGIVSFGIDRCNDRFPSINTNINVVKAFIRNAMMQ